MNFAAMRYKDFIWPHNPSKIDISTKRNISEISIPFGGNVFQDFGRGKRVVSGTGEFFGTDSLEQFNSLFKVFKQTGSGTLAVPKIVPFTAVFKSLQLTEEPAPNVIGYSFEFWEEVTVVTQEDFMSSYHVVVEGETLWEISNEYNVEVEELIKLNPNIKNPNSIIQGERVTLR